MEPTRWQEIEAVFHAALELESHQREAFLAERCGDDDQLRQEVESLLDHSQQDATQVSSAVAETARALFEELSVSGKGTMLGPYRLLEVLGHGGLSTVYLAERADDQYSMRVAIKVVRAGLEDPALLDRLRQERQILASLDHPNIARLLDGGTTENGLPYFVMEHIEGEDLEQFCASRKLSLRQRIALFQDVCAAVDYAHRNLIIHRDIKPANILVTEQGVPKLLDFGIAKLLQPDPGLAAAAPTMTGMQMLTPLFASPEQIRGEPLATATDIYSLGVVLYRLLTGQHPYPVEGASPAQLALHICNTSPTKPSTAASESPIAPVEAPAKIRRLLAGDLDTIALKALRKESARRYTSAQLLSEDLGRHLRGLPVQARPDTLGYRARKFLRRHRLAAATAVGIAGLSLFYTWSVAAERDRARLAAANAEQINEMMVRIFQVNNPEESRGRELTAREILSTGAETLREELTDRPQVLANMLHVIGTVHHNMRLYPEARPYLEEAAELRRSGDRLQLANSLNQLAETRYALEDFDAAAQLAQEALDIRRELLGPEHQDTLISYNNLATHAAYATGDYETAEARYREILEIRQRVLGPRHEDVAGARTNLASTLASQRDRLDQVAPEVESQYREAIDIYRETLGASHQHTANALANLAAFQAEVGNPEAAANSYGEALEVYRTLFSPEAPVVGYLARNQGLLLLRLDRPGEAEPLLREAMGVFDAQGEEELWGRAYVRLNLARALAAQQRSAEAEQLFEEALSQATAATPEGSRLTGEIRARLGELLLAAGRRDDARPLLEVALRELTEHRGPDHELTRQAAESLAALGG